MQLEPAVIERQEGRLRDGLRRIAHALAMRLPAVDTLPLIADEARDALQASTVVVGISEEGEFLRFSVVSGARAHELQGVQVRAADSLADRTLRTGEPMLLVQEPDQRPDDEGAQPFPFPLSPAVAVAPISVDGVTIGALLAMSGEAPAPLSEADLDLLTLFADQASAALALDETERIRADQARELSVLYKASNSVGASLNLQEILDSVLEAVCEHVDFQTATVFLSNDERTHLFVAASRGLADADHDFQLSTESPPIAQTLASGTARILTRAEDLPDLEVLIRDERIRAAMIAPVGSRAEWHGVIVVTSPQPANFTANDLKLLEAVAAHAGIAISNAWLYEDATQRAEHSGALYGLSQRLNASLNADHVYTLAVDSVLHLLNVDGAAILVRNPRTGLLVCRAARGPKADRLKGYTAAVGQGVAGWVYEWETPQAVAHVATDSRNGSAPLENYGISSVLAVPMAAANGPIGVLMASTAHRRLFTVGEMELLYTVANQAAVALTNADLYGRARSQASEMRRYFRRVARALGENMQGDDVPRLFADMALAMTRGAACNVYTLSGSTLYLHATASDGSAFTPDEVVANGSGLTGSVARRGKHLAIEELSTDARAESHAWIARHKFASYLGVPLRKGNEVRGVVEVFTHEAHTNMREEARLLAHFGRLARVADWLEPARKPDTKSGASKPSKGRSPSGKALSPQKARSPRTKRTQ